MISRAATRSKTTVSGASGAASASGPASSTAARLAPPPGRVIGPGSGYRLKRRTRLRCESTAAGPPS
jgi:hypothetical protein